MNRQELIDQIIDHYENPRYFGRLEPVDAVHSSNNPACGDVVTVYLRSSHDGGPVSLSYQGQGCTISQAAASMVMEMMQGLTLAQIDATSVEPLLDRLGPDIASARQRCAMLAFEAVKRAADALRAHHIGTPQSLEASQGLAAPL